jgi:hypothetical protein
MFLTMALGAVTGLRVAKGPGAPAFIDVGAKRGSLADFMIRLPSGVEVR